MTAPTRQGMDTLMKVGVGLLFFMVAIALMFGFGDNALQTVTGMLRRVGQSVLGLLP